MIGLQTELKLANLIKSVGDAEKQIEITRQVLAEQPLFEPYTAFKRIDRLGLGSLSISAFRDFLEDNEITVMDKDIKNIFKIYDANADGRISYTEFLNIVLPKTSPVLRQLCTQRDTYYVGKHDSLPYEVEWALARVLDKEIINLRKIELLKEDLFARYDFNILEAFRLIDEDREGAITHDAIYLFLKRNKIIINESDLQNFLRRADIDNDGCLNYSEFVEIISPFNIFALKSVSEKTSSILERHSVRTASPNRYPSRTKLAQSEIFNSAKKKINNYEYIDYLSRSASKSPAKSSILTETRKMTESLRKSLSKSQNNWTPSRLTPKKVHYDTPLDMDELSISKRKYSTPAKEIVKSHSPSRSLRKSPMKLNEEDHLARSLKEQIDLDHQLESQKNDLAMKSDFNLLDAFRFFDISGKGYITKTELKQGFNEFDIFPSNNEVYLIMRRFDKDNDGILKFSDFCDIFAPKQQQYASILNNRIPSYTSRKAINEVFSHETKHLVRKVLNYVINNEVYSEELRQKLSKRPLFDTYEAFKALDQNNNGFISINEFRDLLAEHGVFPTNKDLLNLMKRYDKNQDGKVTYSEFINELTPKSPQKIQKASIYNYII